MDSNFLPMKMISQLTSEIISEDPPRLAILIFTKHDAYLKGYNLMNYLCDLNPVIKNNEYTFRVTPHKEIAFKFDSLYAYVDIIQNLRNDIIIKEKEAPIILEAELDYYFGIEKQLETYHNYKKNMTEILDSVVNSYTSSGTPTDLYENSASKATIKHFTDLKNEKN